MFRRWRNLPSVTPTPAPVVTPELMAQAYASGRVTLNAAQLADELVQQAAFSVFENAVAGRERANDWWLDHGLSSEQGGLVFFLATEAERVGYTRAEFEQLIAILIAGELLWVSYPYEDDMPEYGLQSINGRQWSLVACREELLSRANNETKGN